MRRSLILLSLIISATTFADDLLDPADYLKILTESKLRYNIVSSPAKTPEKEMTCPRRDERTRVIRKSANDKSLADWKVKAEALKLLEEGEALYQKKDFAGASQKYKEAADIDPEAVDGYLFYGDTLLFGVDDPVAALQQYRKAIALDPTLPTGHFFASTALLHMGRPDDAREEIIKALLYYPGYEVVWKLMDHPERWNAKPIVRYKFDPPTGYLGANGKDGIDVFIGDNGRWLGYAVCKAAWANEKRFAKQHSKEGWSTDEERACVLNQLMGDYNKTENALIEEQKKKGVADPKVSGDEVIAALEPFDRHLWDVAKEKLLDGYIGFEIIGQKCPLAMSMANDAMQQEVEKYIRRYVIVPAK